MKNLAAPESTQKYVLEFEVLGLPSTPNARQHFRKKAKEVKQWREIVACISGARRPPVPLGKAKITFTRLSSARPDFDNLAASFKAVQDGLIDGGIIKNDDHEVIGQPDYRWEPTRPKGGKIKVKVEEVK